MKIIKKDYNGFTLAEVLITLAIIGVVASMTIPTLINNIQKAQYVTGLKKAYTMLQQSFKSYLTDQGVSSIDQSKLYDDSGNPDYGELKNFVTKYFKTIQLCELNNPSCIIKGTNLKNPTSDPLYEFGDDATSNSSYYSFVTADGMYIGFYMYDKSYFESSPCSFIYIDVNGKKAPNKNGRDYFIAALSLDGDVLPLYSEKFKRVYAGFPNWVESDTCGSADDTDISNGTSGDGCFARIMEQGWEMKY